jgi:hypothetical protein
MGVLFTYEKVTRCPFSTKMFSPFKRTKARNTTGFHVMVVFRSYERKYDGGGRLLIITTCDLSKGNYLGATAHVAV